ncbi:bifunctional glutamate N-acetyltransferase/amino-acid acetyltransferase ArgJ [Dermatobacter hominis]|uniref:bifunctional glutamate N-acetyltransferase/amino-acid acetyltransferase ArgJ n=1 Tax=Dermatobacter hominis TaxID=2884263 RepID=UPI001D10F51C|nr:bifunctional glutamate N-acetyltransferase/amino-acid acetyltransferase ArgJ [Dermatobacter hominis]UDY35393.1 bifunctional glutamate N-acetyltransferase/amino-acid acetyltransferase ArgJ [Dermatobacter hominis]
MDDAATAAAPGAAAPALGDAPLPAGFAAHVANVGIKDDTDDFVVIAADRPCVAAAVFTRSRFAGPSVEVSRRHAADGTLQAIVVVSKNANVATGEQGLADAEELATGVAAAIGADPGDVLVASTGVIGRPYPMDRIRSHVAALRTPFDGRHALAAATGIMTTDTHPKIAFASLPSAGGTATVVGIAKGVGMIEPDMATMLAFVLTDAEVDAATLDAAFRRVVDRTFNSLSVDTDTSTSDTAAVLASGRAGAVDPAELEAALGAVCLDLTRQLAADGEGAETLLVVRVTGARDDDQARRVAKAVVNSPLVKTAVHGADPNWGRVVMAIGKCSDDTDIDQDRVRVRFGESEVYPADPGPDGLAELEGYLRSDEVLIDVDLGIAAGEWTVYGCDLTDGYVRINADYTT